MSSLIVARPFRPVAWSGSPATYDRALSGDPKEAAVLNAQAGVWNFDYGVAVTLDTVFVGYHTGAAAQTVTVTTSATLGGATVGTPQPAISLVPFPTDGPAHGFARFNPVMSRYWTVTVSAGTYNVGVVALAASVQPTYGREYGSGRGFTDTSNISRLFGGGFAIDEGVVIPWFQWTMGELTDAEVEALYAHARRVGESRAILVVEDPDRTAGLNERIHWGLLAKIDAYERFAPGATRWAMRVDDWS
jgi:hypothetical protein